MPLYSIRREALSALACVVQAESPKDSCSVTYSSRPADDHSPVVAIASSPHGGIARRFMMRAARCYRAAIGSIRPLGLHTLEHRNYTCRQSRRIHLTGIFSASSMPLTSSCADRVAGAATSPLSPYALSADSFHRVMKVLARHTLQHGRMQARGRRERRASALGLNERQLRHRARRSISARRNFNARPLSASHVKLAASPALS